MAKIVKFLPERFNPDPLLLKESPAAKVLGYATETLRQKRRAGTGPVHYRFGKNDIRYRLIDLLRWQEAHRHDPQPVESCVKSEGGKP